MHSFRLYNFLLFFFFATQQGITICHQLKKSSAYSMNSEGSWVIYHHLIILGCLQGMTEACGLDVYQKNVPIGMFFSFPMLQFLNDSYYEIASEFWTRINKVLKFTKVCWLHALLMTKQAFKAVWSLAFLFLRLGNLHSRMKTRNRIE